MLGAGSSSTASPYFTSKFLIHFDICFSIILLIYYLLLVHNINILLCFIFVYLCLFHSDSDEGYTKKCVGPLPPSLTANAPTSTLWTIFPGADV